MLERIGLINSVNSTKNLSILSKWCITTALTGWTFIAFDNYNDIKWKRHKHLEIIYVFLGCQSREQNICVFWLLLLRNCYEVGSFYSIIQLWFYYVLLVRHNILYDWKKCLSKKNNGIFKSYGFPLKIQFLKTLRL